MVEHSFSRDDEPAIRATVDDAGYTAFPCPFCGARLLKVNWMDLPQDSQRVTVYCDNTYCVAREIEIVTTRGEGAHLRGDVAALRAIDSGTDDEQAAEGTLVERDADGHIEQRVTSYAEASIRRSPGERDIERRDRRLRPTTVIVLPIPQEDAEL